MGYKYPGYGLRTKADYSRQLYQNCDTTARFSGSTEMDQSLFVNLSADTTTYNFSLTSTSASTAVFAMGLTPDLTIGKSGIQILPSLLQTGSYNDLEIDTATGEVYRAASSLRYKKDIQPISPQDLSSVLRLTPVSFKWKSNDKKSVGLIAEQVHDVGLTDFVTYNEKGEPDGVSYKLLTVALISVLQNNTQTQLKLNDTKETTENIPVVISTDYTTSQTRYIIAKNDLTITLDGKNLKRFYIKSMANIKIKPLVGKIDEEWEEINMGPQSSIELLCEGTDWYVLSSDGLKNS
tara:strand:- start:5 stop:883 length:879 start_codon:yes stop_codon:yes gene_type:complete